MPSREFEVRIELDTRGIERRLDELRQLIEASNAGIEVSTERMGEVQRAAAEALQIDPELLAPQPGQIFIDQYDGVEVLLPDVAALDAGEHPNPALQTLWSDAGRDVEPPESTHSNRVDDEASRLRPETIERRLQAVRRAIIAEQGGPLRLPDRSARRGCVPTFRTYRLPPVSVELDFTPTSLQCMCCWAGKRALDVQACMCLADERSALAMHALATQLTLLCKTCQQCRAHCECAKHQPDPTGRKIVL